MLVKHFWSRLEEFLNSISSNNDLNQEILYPNLEQTTVLMLLDSYFEDKCSDKMFTLDIFEGKESENLLYLTKILISWNPIKLLLKRDSTNFQYAYNSSWAILQTLANCTSISSVETKNKLTEEGFLKQMIGMKTNILDFSHLKNCYLKLKKYLQKPI